ncbi:MAG: DNA topoisomerase IV subunit A [Spirochaetales bacterium]|nr:DNA topoisomerase IV subunit A [Spirochaetales bacterium]
MSELKPLMEKNFIDYASYVIIDRAIPDIRDGCKPVQRRLLYTLHNMDDGKFHKVANVIGETMKLHPHGDLSITDALVVLANKEYFIEKQGNFGNVLTGHNAAAARYIECRLTPLARETLFNRSMTEFLPSYDGRRDEPVYLPSKLPVLLMLGTEGIAVGMSTKILSHNFIELLEAQIKILKKQEFQIYPDFFQGGYIDVSEYEDGLGKVRIRAKIEEAGPKKLIIREIPFSTTTTNLIASIESAAQRGKVSVGSINDFTTEKVEIELNCSRGAMAKDVIKELYAYTDCEVSISSNIVTISKNHPMEITVSKYLQMFTKQLKDQIKAELEWELAQLTDRQHWLTLEHIFIVNKVYKRIEKARSEKQIFTEVRTGMLPFKKQFIRPIKEEDIKRLIELKIRRISAYDIKKHQDDIDDIVAKIRETEKKLKALNRTTINYLKGLADKYREQYPRRTVITSFQTVDKKQVAKADIRMNYDPEKNYYGADVRGSEFKLTATEFDKILLITDDGAYRIVAPPSKLLLTGRLLYADIFNPDKGLTIVFIYLDDKGHPWGKELTISKYITDKIYSLFPPSQNGIIFFTHERPLPKIILHFKKKARQKIKEAKYNLKDIKPATKASRGTKIYDKPVESIEIMEKK